MAFDEVARMRSKECLALPYEGVAFIVSWSRINEPLRDEVRGATDAAASRVVRRDSELGAGSQSEGRPIARLSPKTCTPAVLS